MGLLRGEEWRESVVFPRIILCDFAIRRLANPQQHTVQCVIMLNLINEKFAQLLLIFPIVHSICLPQTLLLLAFLVPADWFCHFGQLPLLFDRADVARIAHIIRKEKHQQTATKSGIP